MSYYERPEFKVILKEKPFEVRQYEPFYAVTYSYEEDKTMDQGFKTLFKYLSKHNDEEVEISMTVPVIEVKKEKMQRMSFVLPRVFGADPPKPLDPRLEITKFEGNTYAVISYRGTSNAEKEGKKEEGLMSWIEKHHWEVSGTPHLAYYNPPFIPGILKYNEIMVKIEYTVDRIPGK